MSSVELTDNEWGQVMEIIADKVSWKVANPLLMKIGSQLQSQVLNRPPQDIRVGGNNQDQEASRE